MNRRSPRGATWLASALVVVTSVALAAEPPPSATLERELLAASNAARAEHGLPPLSPDPGLARAARAHAAENAERGILDHGSPDPARDTPIERVGLAGVALVEVGENLALMPGGDVAAASVRGWLASPPHRANLLNPHVTHAGFGTAVGPGGTYVTQLVAARPLTRLSATADPAPRQERLWSLRLVGPAGMQVGLFVDGDVVDTGTLDASGATLTIPASDGAREVTLGMAIAPGRYAPTDRVRLAPDGDWRRDPGAPAGSARVAEARLRSSVETGVEIALVYDDPHARLRLLVDGTHRPEVLPDDGALRVWLPEADAPREIAVGLAGRDGRIRVLERFTLAAGADGALTPGTSASLGGAP